LFFKGKHKLGEESMVDANNTENPNPVPTNNGATQQESPNRVGTKKPVVETVNEKALAVSEAKFAVAELVSRLEIVLTQIGEQREITLHEIEKAQDLAIKQIHAERIMVVNVIQERVRGALGEIASALSKALASLGNSSTYRPSQANSGGVDMRNRR
jgi:hypothetical protein